MKKYLSGLFAIVIAVSLSAFTLNKAHTNTATTTYWWYDVSTQDLLNPGGKTDLPPGTDCELTGGDICAFGHETQTGTPTVGYDETAHFPIE